MKIKFLGIAALLALVGCESNSSVDTLDEVFGSKNPEVILPADTLAPADTVVKDTAAKDTVAKDSVAKDTTAKDTASADTSDDVTVEFQNEFLKYGDFSKASIRLSSENFYGPYTFGLITLEGAKLTEDAPEDLQVPAQIYVQNGKVVSEFTLWLTRTDSLFEGEFYLNSDTTNLEKRVFRCGDGAEVGVGFLDPESGNLTTAKAMRYERHRAMLSLKEKEVTVTTSSFVDVNVSDPNKKDTVIAVLVEGKADTMEALLYKVSAGNYTSGVVFETYVKSYRALWVPEDDTVKISYYDAYAKDTLSQTLVVKVKRIDDPFSFHISEITFGGRFTYTDFRRVPGDSAVVRVYSDTDPVGFEIHGTFDGFHDFNVHEYGVSKDSTGNGKIHAVPGDDISLETVAIDGDTLRVSTNFSRAVDLDVVGIRCPIHYSDTLLYSGFYDPSHKYVCFLNSENSWLPEIRRATELETLIGTACVEQNLLTIYIVDGQEYVCKSTGFEKY